MTDQTPVTSRFDDLKTRIIAAVVAAAIAFLFVWTGGAISAIFIAVVAGLMLHELVRLVGSECDLQSGSIWILIISGVLAVFCMHLAPPAFVGIAVLGLVATYVLNPARLGPYTILGYLSIVFACGGAVFLRDTNGGFLLLSWIVICVVAADIGGYIFGRLIGGPKLLPKISPKKTWSGFLGGVVLSLGVAAIYGVVNDGNLPVILLLGLLIAVVSVAGDLLESSVKRKFGAKDSGTLLPGHGGLLDRFDGMSAVMILFLALSMFVDIGPLLSADYMQAQSGGAGL